ncbi:MAG: pantetheine-phosphate adenylyltransferase [Muribaculaceae bacterium]|nr:pantetheine-phosphate adenylyltransferase [Muribaculaceae bacterium]
MKKIFYAGSFNPFTKGHADILQRLLALADEVVIGIGVNIDKPETSLQAERNEEAIRRYLEAEGLCQRVTVKRYTGLTAVVAREEGATCMARGVRNATDFDYEFSLAAANRDAFGIETILLPANPALSFVSSTLIRDLEARGYDDLARKYLPEISQDK